MPTRIPACGLHPGYEKQGMGDQCSFEAKVPFNASSNYPSIRAAIALVARMESGEDVENIDRGASPRIPACGLHPGYEKQGMGDQYSFEAKVPFNASSNCRSISAAIALVARMRPEGSHLGWRPEGSPLGGGPQAAIRKEAPSSFFSTPAPDSIRATNPAPDPPL